MKRYLAIFAIFSLGFVLLISAKQDGLDPAPETEAELGELLFNDPILSLDETISCATCHIPAFAFADTAALSVGVGGKLGTRNSPSVMNMAFRPYFFYDGRAATLEEQVQGPIENPVEMNLHYADGVARIQGAENYQAYFTKVYQAAPDSANILAAIAAFIRTLESEGMSAVDQWVNGEDTTLLGTSAIRGREVFLNKGKCFDCHFGPDFTGDEFRNIGLYDEVRWTDRGRYEISKDSTDLGKFKVPGLRNIAITAPYMHDGSFATLEEVVDYYDRPLDFVQAPINMDTLLQDPLGLTDQEKKDLVAFMEALTDPEFVEMRSSK